MGERQCIAYAVSMIIEQTPSSVPGAARPCGSVAHSAGSRIQHSGGSVVNVALHYQEGAKSVEEKSLRTLLSLPALRFTLHARFLRPNVVS